MSANERLLEATRALDPVRPVTSFAQALYVDPPDGGAHEKIARWIRREPEAHLLMLGGIGSGKTTELLAARATLEREGLSHAWHVELDAYFDLSAPREGMLVTLAGLAMLAALERAGAHIDALLHPIAVALHRSLKVRRGATPALVRDEYLDRSVSAPARPVSALAASIKPLVERWSALERRQRNITLLIDSMDRRREVDGFLAMTGEDLPVLRNFGIGVAIDTAGRQAMHEIDVQVRNTPTTTLPAAEVTRLTAWFEARRSARYMEGSCQATTYPGWTGIPLKLCRYRVSDVFSGGTRWADVILADAEPAQLARWVVQAAMERRGRVLRSDTDAICSDIIGQSGAQFPVAGVVYEDMDGSGQRIYPFRNGVTVRIAGLAYATHEQPTTTQMAAYRTGSIAFVGHYGRIAGTQPDEWTALTGEAVPADRSTWPDIVGRAYRQAWGQDRNALIVAWARANL